MSLQTPPSSPAVSRIIPTRRAAVALLIIDAVLISILLVVPFHIEMAFAYVPLLITVAMGALMSGWGKRVLAVNAILMLFPFAWLGVAIARPSAGLDALDLALRVGNICVVCLGVMWTCAAVWGWVRYFSGRSDMAASSSA